MLKNGVVISDDDGEVSALAQDIAAQLAHELAEDPDGGLEISAVGVQKILDKVETVGGFDLSDYEDDDDDEDDSFDDDELDVDEYDDDDDDGADPTARYGGGFWTDPNDPTA